jgi:hypothetical protein
MVVGMLIFKKKDIDIILNIAKYPKIAIMRYAKSIPV